MTTRRPLAVTYTALRDTIRAFHAHLPQMTFAMFDVGLFDLFETVSLYQLDNSAKPGLHVES